MRLTLTLPLALVAAVTTAAGAQRVRVLPSPDVQPRVFQFDRGDDEPRAALGVSTGGSGSARDTVGVLVTSVVSNGPAEKAGIEEGNRIAAINGVNLKVASADVGDWDVSNAMSRRLTRELSKVKPGDEVELRVYSSGQTRSVRVRTVDSDSLFRRRRFSRSDIDDRATLGFGIGSTGSRRDTLGVLVMFVNDSGPAARAGIEEGNRIAAINGTDLRVSRDDSGDDFVASAKSRRLMREISDLRAGDDVELRVYANGQFRTVKLKAARVGDLPRRRGAFMTTGDGMTIMSPMIGGGFPFGVDGAVIGDDVRRAVERAMESAGRAVEGVGRGLGGIRWRSDWHDDMDADRAPSQPPQLDPLDSAEPRVEGGVRAPTRMRVPYRSAVLPETEAVWALPAIARSPRIGMRAEGAGVVNLLGLRLVPVSGELASYFGEGSERGVLVVEAPEWADALRAGDVLLRVNGKAVRAKATSEDMAIELDRSHDTSVELLRGGRLQTVTLPASR